ncbi:MAG: adenylate/guanylate cyclase domain-containing protein [Planctomycetota bacterium]|nr:adenylate/guanylate cyclase domain-containing protein [Planctomycetota bacterium]
MTVLVAVGPNSERGSCEVLDNVVIRIGRSPLQGFAVAWDRMVSREHADIVWKAGRLEIACLEKAANPVFHDKHPHRKLTVDAGETFWIGKTQFTINVDKPQEFLEDIDEFASPQQHAYGAQEIAQFAFGETKLQMQLLEQVPHLIESVESDTEMAAKMADLLLEAIPKAEVVAAVQFEVIMAESTVVDQSVQEIMQSDAKFNVNQLIERSRDEGESNSSSIRIGEMNTLRVATRPGFIGRFTPSRRLLLSALKRQQTIVYLWGFNDEDSGRFTVSDGLDWAYCCPIPGESCRGWCLYVSGQSRPEFSSEFLRGDLRFTSMAAKLIGSIRQLRTLQSRNAQLSRFFSPSVVNTLSTQASLEPTEGNISILFCDVRGFSRLSEHSQENLKHLLTRINLALELMTHAILDNQGAIADFQGDAALGFWGWPSPIVDGPLRAARAAMMIREDFEHAAQVEGGPLEGFRVGIGLSHGWAIAGTIGTSEQTHLTVLGHVVNLGSRLEGLTKKFKVSILMDVTTAQFVRQHLPAAEGVVRKLARVRPAGMDSSVTVFELIPASVLQLSKAQLDAHETAVEAFTEGRWDRAVKLLETVPESDPSREMLLQYIEEHGHKPPTSWDGVITFDSK